MSQHRIRNIATWVAVAALLASILACNLPGSVPATRPANPATSAPLPASANTPTQPPIATAPAGSTATAAPQATDTATATRTPIVHSVTPGQPGAAISAMSDSNSSSLASQHRANGGDNFAVDLYERPFSSNTMDYSADLDITSAKLMRDAAWVYVNITLAGQNASGGLLGDYGVEVDLNMDGRGDLLVMAAKPGAAWSTDGVRVWSDPNHDVGGAHPIASDPPSNTDGYENLVFDQGVGSDPDAAWARLSPSDPNSVQLAFKGKLINDSSTFMWGAWAASDAMLNPAWFDYNDHFTLAQAGSPLVEDKQNYPLKALADVDNTCRWVVGFTPTGNEPGICPVPATPTPTPTATMTPTRTLPPPVIILPGTVNGTIYDNGVNGGLVYVAGVSKPAPGTGITVRSGNCSSPGGVVKSATTTTGSYTFSLPAGTYCLSATTTGSNQTGPQTVTLTAGGTVNNINFFFYEYLG